MKLDHLDIYNFGKLSDRHFDFGDGIHVIRGGNEAGKSTLHTCISSLLFGLERPRGRAARTSLLNHYQPWTSPEIYGGCLDLQSPEGSWRIERDFSANPPLLTITDLQSGRQLPAGEDTAAILPPELTRTLFCNTLSFRQNKTAAEDSLSGDLHNHIINLETAGNETINISRSLSSLQKKKKLLSSELSPHAEEEYRRITEQIQELQNNQNDKAAGRLQYLRQKKAEASEEFRTLVKEQQQIDQDVRHKEQILNEHAVSNHADIRDDIILAENLKEQNYLYKDTYEKKQPLNARKLLFLLIFSGLGTILSLWMASRIFLQKNPLPALAFFLAAVFFGAVFLRMERKMTALSSQTKNLKILDQLNIRYQPPENPEYSDRPFENLLDWLKQLDHLLDYMEKLRSRNTAALDHMAQLQKQITEIDQRLEIRLQEAYEAEQAELQLRSLEEQQASAFEKVRRNQALKNEICAIDLAMEKIRSLAGELFDTLGYHLASEASQILSEITGGLYDYMTIDENLQITLRRDGRKIPMTALSCGTLEQVYFALRIACIRFLWPQETIPLFFDDTFAMYDRTRLAALLNWLHTSYPGQVFLFTCEEREEELLRQVQIPYTRIEL